MTVGRFLLGLEITDVTNKRAFACDFSANLGLLASQSGRQ